MDAARRKARVDWYARLKEENEELWCRAQNKLESLEAEAQSLPRGERLTAAERADIVDAITGCQDDPEHQADILRYKKEIADKIRETKANRKKTREEIIRDETRKVINGDEPSAPQEETAEPVAVVGDPKDVLWAMENLGNDRVMRAAAPTGTAWTLLAAGRKNPDSLLRLYQQVCIPSKKELEDAATDEEAFDHLDDVLRRVIDIAEKAIA
tara:strand:+ start:50 stop:685 length:636 start_codon:yes stop_codon:yes gene_type:complete